LTVAGVGTILQISLPPNDLRKLLTSKKDSVKLMAELEHSIIASKEESICYHYLLKMIDKLLHLAVSIQVIPKDQQSY